MMEVNKQQKLSFQGVDIININFNSENILVDDKSIDLKIKPMVFYPDNSDVEFKITFETIVECEGFFFLSLNAVGHFSIEGEVDPEMKKGFVNTNAPAIMFPYIRSFITTLTSNLGHVTGALVIPPHFFIGDLEEIKH